MVMTENVDLPPVSGTDDAHPSRDVTEALAEVEEQMMQLAAYVRGAIREAATHVDPALQRWTAA
jgi:hypothetical protein